MLKPDAALRKDVLGALSPATFQHRHFATVAGIIKDLPGTYRERDKVATYFGMRLAETNPNFNLARFLAACGITE